MWHILAVLAFYEHFSHCVGFTYLNSQPAFPHTHTHLHTLAWALEPIYVTVSESGKNLICIHFWIWCICLSLLAFLLWFARILFQIFHHQDLFPHTDVLHSVSECMDLTFAILCCIFDDKSFSSYARNGWESKKLGIEINFWRFYPFRQCRKFNA